MKMIYPVQMMGRGSIEKGDKGLPDTIPENISQYSIFRVIWQFHI